MEIEYGYCQCGCGGKTGISDHNTRSRGHVKGEPFKCLPNHSPIIPLEDRFWMYVDKTGSCWEWQRHREKSGYGVIKHGGRPINAHRVSWMLTHGEIPDGLCVLHKCDNPPCVNPDHLFLGTHLDNALDREVKGRGICGERSGLSKLKDNHVLEIRSLAEKIPAQMIAGIYNISIATVRLIIARKTWKHI